MKGWPFFDSLVSSFKFNFFLLSYSLVRVTQCRRYQAQKG